MSSVNDQSRIAAMFRSFVGDMFYDIHTSVPAVITSIDYSKGFCSARPLIKTKRNDDKIYAEPEIHDIPLTGMIVNGGKVVMTFPFKTGDKVYVTMADRDSSSLVEGSNSSLFTPELKQPMGYYPIGITPLHTKTSGVKVDPNNIVIANESSNITIKPASINIISSGVVGINGAQVTADGDFVTANGVSLNNHRHNGGPPPDQ